MLRTSFVKIINENFIPRCKRWQSTANSSRQRAWLAARERYKNYEHVHYSSVLELGQRLPKLTADSSSSSLSLNWMHDYEFYKGEEDAASPDGTPDPSVPASNVPCSGCGAHLHCSQITLPGYIPSEIFKGRTPLELKTIICQRCHFLKNFNIALDVEVSPSSYVETISRIQNEFALAIVLVDLLDFPSSIWPGLQHVLGSKRPVFLVGNKVDLLPRDSNSYLNHVKLCLKEQFIQHGGGEALNIKNVSLISAKTGYGIEELITQLQKIWAHQGDVYLLGCTNVGKSSLFNILLHSDYCRPEASDRVPRATTCPWPGTTLKLLRFPILRPSDLRIYQRFQRLFSERAEKAALEQLRRDQARAQKGSAGTAAAQPRAQVGRTFVQREVTNDTFALASGSQPITHLNERAKEYKEARWVYDTPGVMQPDQITSLLTSEELTRLQSPKMITPRAFRLRPQMTLFLGGLARVDLLDISSEEEKSWKYLKMFVFASEYLPVLIADTEQAETVYNRYLGSPLLGVPISGEDDRLKRWPGLQSLDKDILVTSEGQDRDGKLNCDITLSSSGWLGLMLPYNSSCSLRVWTPEARGIYVRHPPLIPLADRLVGKHVRNSLAYNISRPFVFKK